MTRRKRGTDGDERSRELADEARYVCADCGEEIVVPVDASAGTSQSYVEDCPVCCRPQRITIEIDEDGSVRCHADSE